jgi:hypothetical protein
MPELPGVGIDSRLSFLNAERLPAVITARPGETMDTLLSQARDSLAAIRLQYGAILLRGFGLKTADDFSCRR